MKKSILLRTCAFAILPLAATVVPTAVEAQQITTEIRGQVTNASGGPLANATVTVIDMRTGISQSFNANDQGQFTAQNLQTGGPYTVTATAAGHQGQTVEQIFTNLQGPTQLTFALSPVSAQAEAGTIVITAARAKVTQLEIGPGSSFGTRVLDNAPSFNRDVRDVIRIDPRVSLDREDAATGGSGADRISCLGGNDRGNSFTVDGILQGDVYGLNDTGFSSRSSTPVPYDAVRETQVQFAPFDVEYGQFTGCTINVVTRSGSNQFHGGGFYEFSNNHLRGDEVRDKAVAPIEPDKRYGISFGGPILKERLFFFGAYEHQKGGFSQDIGPAGAGYPNDITGVPVAAFNAITDAIRQLYGIDSGPLVTSRPFKNKRFFGRGDWQITDDHRLEVTYQRLKESTVQSDDNATSTFPQNAVGGNTFFLSGTNSKYYSGRLYSNWTDRLSTELRYSHSNIIDIQDPVGGGEAQSGSPIVRIIVGIDNPTGTPDGTVQVGPGFSRSANDLRSKIDQYRALANYDAGAHRLKLGFELNRADIFNLFVQNATGTLTFRNLADLQAGILSPGTGNFDTFPSASGVVSGSNEGAYINASRTGDVNDAAAKFKRSVYSLYAQDDWTVTDDLNLVLGLRTDWFRGGHPDENPLFEARYGFKNTTGFSDLNAVIMPRIGFTYDVSDFAVFGRPKLQGGVGIFSGGDPLVWFSNAFQNNGFGFAEGTTQSCTPGTFSPVLVGGHFTGFPQCALDAAVSRAALGEGDAQSVDPDIKMPTVWRANIGFQTDLNFAPEGFFHGWRMNLDYIFSWYKNPFTIVDLSQTPAVASFSGGAPGPAVGLNGFTIDGRPIYRAIDPTVAGCDAELVAITPNPIWTNVTGACFNTSRDDELMLTNAGGYRTHVASAILSKSFAHGIFTPEGNVFFNAGYSYTDAHDRRNMFNSTAGSNYDQTAAFDRQNPAASRGFFESRHNVTLSTTFTERFFSDLATTLGLTFVARSGRPYSLTFEGSGVFNDSVSGSNNSLIYIPTGITDPNISPTSNVAAVNEVLKLAASLDCARDYFGKTIARNTCSNDWYYDLDLRFSQELPGVARLISSDVKDKFTVYAMMDNVLNFFNKDWNVQWRRNFAGLQVAGRVSGFDSQGRYIFAPLPNGEVLQDRFNKDRFINVSGSVWRVKFGVSYKF